MLHYKFFCHDCKEYFSKIFSPIDYEEGEVICPKCGSKRVEQRPRPTPTMITSSGSA